MGTFLGYILYNILYTPTFFSTYGHSRTVIYVRKKQRIGVWNQEFKNRVISFSSGAGMLKKSSHKDVETFPAIFRVDTPMLSSRLGSFGVRTKRTNR